MVVFPNAKINLGLFITEKRNDGFHSIESIFYPIEWTDVLEFIPSPQTVFTNSGIDIPGSNEDNLCLKAYYTLKKDFHVPELAFHLQKNIPIGAGLGGGSADAAFCLKALNEKFNLQIPTEKLEEYIRPLGSDCAFFIQNTPKYCFEKGDVFKETSVSLKGHQILLIYPNLHISTKEAYSGIIPNKINFDFKKRIEESPIENWKHFVENDFEKSLFPKYPILEQLKKELYNHGALYASMTGSGSTIYGIFKNIPTELLTEYSKFTIKLVTL